MAELFADQNRAAEPQDQAPVGQEQPKQDDAPPAWVAGLLEGVGKMVDDKIKSAIPQAPAPKQSDDKAQPVSINDAEEAAARRFAFEKAIDGMPTAAQDKLRGLYAIERPKDVTEWVGGYASAFGLGKGQAMAQGTNHGGAPVTNGGVPKMDRSLANYGKTIFDVSQDDVQASVRENGLLETGRRFRSQMRKDLPGHLLKIK